MSMKIVWTVVVCLLLAPLGVHTARLHADGSRPGKWWQSAACKTAVGLTEAQSGEIERIFQSVRDELRAEKLELERQEAALSRLLADANDDEAVVVRTIDRVEAARSALAKTRTLMLYRMHRKLSPDQRTRLEAFEQQRARDGKDAAPKPRP